MKYILCIVCAFLFGCSQGKDLNTTRLPISQGLIFFWPENASGIETLYRDDGSPKFYIYGSCENILYLEKLSQALGLCEQVHRSNLDIIIAFTPNGKIVQGQIVRRLPSMDESFVVEILECEASTLRQYFSDHKYLFSETRQYKIAWETTRRIDSIEAAYYSQMAREAEALREQLESKAVLDTN